MQLLQSRPARLAACMHLHGTFMHHAHHACVLACIWTTMTSRPGGPLATLQVLYMRCCCCLQCMRSRLICRRCRQGQVNPLSYPLASSPRPINCLWSFPLPFSFLHLSLSITIHACIACTIVVYRSSPWIHRSHRDTQAHSHMTHA